MIRTLLLLTGAGFIFAQPAAPPAFEVASIKASVPPVLSAPLRVTPGGLVATGVSVDYLIQWAYGIRDFQLTGGPDWIKSGRFEIQAKSENAASEGQIKLMLQTLLAERFHLQFHRDTKEFSGYALTVAKNGPRLQPAKTNPDRGNIQIAGGSLWGYGESMAAFAGALTILVERPVFDKTGLDGKYEFKLEYDPSSVRIESTSSGAAVAASPGASGSVFSALQEQLGLRLDSFKGPLEILVIDRLEKPTEN